MLVDLAERGRIVAVRTVAARVLRGSLHHLGIDFLALSDGLGEVTLVPLSSITALSPEPGTPSTLGDRMVQTNGTLAHALVDVAGEGSTVSLHSVAGDRFAGRLAAVGRDVLVVATASGHQSYVPLPAVNDVVVK